MCRWWYRFPYGTISHINLARIWPSSLQYYLKMKMAVFFVFLSACHGNFFLRHYRLSGDVPPHSRAGSDLGLSYQVSPSCVRSFMLALESCCIPVVIGGVLILTSFKQSKPLNLPYKQNLITDIWIADTLVSIIQMIDLSINVISYLMWCILHLNNRNKQLSTTQNQ